MAEQDFWRNRIIESGAASPEELAKGMNPLNWRGHPEAQREALEEALDSIGFLQRVLVNRASGRVIDGHLRIELAVLKGQPLIPVDYVELTDDEEALALATLDAITEQAEPIADKLAALMERTRAMVADKPGLAGMLDRLKQQAGVNGKGQQPTELPPPVDKAAELQEIWQVKPGQIWQAGRHFIICGDCRDGDTWKRLLGAAGIEKINGVFTSPPYAEQRKAQYGGVPTAEYVEWWEAVQGNVRANLAGDGSFFVNIKPNAEDKERRLYVLDLVCAMVRNWQWLFVDEYCWLRTGIPQQVVNRFKNQFEPVYWFASSESFKFYPENVQHFSKDVPIALGPGAGDTNAARRQGRGGGAIQGNTIAPGMAYPGNVLDLRQNADALGHSAAFPVALPTFFIKAYSDPGDVWLDPFCGSGTTLVAAHNEGRVGLGIEQLPKYVSVICERLKTNGLTPTLIDQGAR